MLLLTWACSFQNNLNMHAGLKYYADLKYFGKLALELVTLGCLLKGLSGRHSRLHGILGLLFCLQSAQGFCLIWVCFVEYFVLVSICWFGVLVFFFPFPDFQILFWLYSFIFMAVFLLSQAV